MHNPKRANAATADVAIIQPPLPSGMRRLVWGAWPAPDARLRIHETPGVWAFRTGIEYGHMKAVALVAWDDRANVMTAWTVAPLVAVSMEVER